MLDQPSVSKALEEKREYFRQFETSQLRQKQTLNRWLDALREYDYRSMLEKLKADGPTWPGAYPTEEFDEAERLCLPFDQRWDDHQEARAWAHQILADRTTIAVDGSQIAPSPEYRPLVGATQIGWFINQHKNPGRYVKDLAFEVLAPDELIDRVGDSGDDSGGEDESVATQIVNQVRFVKECERLCRLMAAQSERTEDRWPLSFFDGSFIISFAGKINETRATHYINAILDLLATSERYRSPLLGFVDSSRSRDLVSMLNALVDHTAGDDATNLGEMSISDGLLLEDALQKWGDRTPFFVCARNDGLSSTDRAFFYNDVVFCYMRLSMHQPLARVELPLWIYEEGLASDVLDILRAECVVGTGYPYAIETADALAVISQQDRRRFYGMFQRFLDGEDLLFRQTRKAQSKRTRR